MATLPTSAHWYRVSGLHPRLRGHVRVMRQMSRSLPWYLLIDGLRGRTHRINASAYHFIGRCDGKRSIGEIWTHLTETTPEQAPSQDEVIHLLGQLNRRGLLQSDHPPDLAPLFHSELKERRLSRMQAMNPLSFRVALFDPSALLARFDRIAPSLFGWPALILWLFLVTWGGTVALAQWPALQSHAAIALFDTRGMLMMWFGYILLKTLHELAHGIAVRRWGGMVHRAGISMLLMTPVPFVDASEASAFASRRERFLVGAAGIMAELLVAACALIVWVQIQPGLLRDFCLVLASIGGISTVLVNANPLLRFDGYFMLTDLLQLPNLHARSAAYWRHLVLRHALRVNEPPPESAPGEVRWLLAFAPLSWFYRLLLSFWIVGWLLEWSTIAALLVGLFSLWTLLVMPVRDFLLSLRRRAPEPGQAGRPMRFALIWCAAFALIGLALPLPYATLAEGVVWPAEHSQLRPGESGFIERFLVKDGAQVQAGDRIAEISNPALLVEAERLRQELLSRENEYYRLMFSDPVTANVLQADIARFQADLADIQQRIGQLEIVAGVTGRVSLSRQDDLIGTYAERGKLLGHIISEQSSSLQVALPHHAAGQIGEATRQIEIRLAESPWRALLAGKPRLQPAASHQLPSAALGEWAGGRLSVRPGEESVTREPVFIIELTVDELPGERIGGRAWVRFEHAPTPLLLQWAHALRQLFIGAPTSAS